MIIMLIRKLKLPGYTFVTKILYSFMGLVSTFLAVIKIIVDQPILVKVENCDRMNPSISKQDVFENVESAKRVKINRSGTFKL